MAHSHVHAVTQARQLASVTGVSAADVRHGVAELAHRHIHA